MNLPTIIETAFSVVTVIIILSIITSAAYELLGRYTRGRSKLLRKAIDQALGDPALQKNYAELFYNHPQIKSLKRTTLQMPSYISPDIFANSLIDVVIEEFETENLEIDKDSREYSLPQKIKDAGKLERFNWSVANLGYSELGRFLKSMSGDKDDLESVKENVVKWYSGYMDRVSGWYKRLSQKRLFILGFIVALALNVNLITITKEIYNKSEIRKDLVLIGSALQLEENYSDFSSGDLVNVLKDNYQLLDKAGISLGWRQLSTMKTLDSKEKVKALILMFFGWVICAVAVTRGAPFWFGVLSSIGNLRSTGKTGTEKS